MDFLNGLTAFSLEYLDIIKLLVVFAAIILLIRMKKSMSVAMLCGAGLTAILYGIGIVPTIDITLRSITSWGTISLLLILYLITFIQRMLEKRGHLDLAQKSLNGLFNNRRVNASLASIFIGLLPSPGAVTICGAMVNASCEDYLDKEEKAVVASFFRHIPESFLPTYTGIILALQLSGVGVSSFLLGMFPMVLLLIFLGYFFYLRKIPKDTGYAESTTKLQDFKDLCGSLWTIVLTIALILTFNMTVYAAALITIVLSIFVNKFKPKELVPMVRSAFEPKIMLNTAAIMIFKDILTATGVIELLPDLFSKLPIPSFLVFMLIFFFGTIVSGSNAIIVLCMPLAFAAIPGSGMPLLVLLMSCAYAAMQISPTHICLAIAAEYFDVSMGSIIKKTMPIELVFLTILPFYYLALNVFF